MSTSPSVEPRLVNHHLDTKAWQTFKDSGMLWFTNRILHTFGYAITMCYDIDSGELTQVVPLRVGYRGFGPDSEARGFERIHQYLLDNMPALHAETYMEDE